VKTFDQVLTAHWATPVIRERARQAALIPHLASAVFTIVFFGFGLISVDISARWLTAHYIQPLAPGIFDQKNHGILLQKEAFAQPNLLPIYGSSELVRPSQYHVIELFQNYPTGFAVFPVGDLGTPPLIFVESLAGVGADLRGKKVVISLSPIWFTSHEALRKDTYIGNFSTLQAGEVAFSTELSLELKQQLARRMLYYPQTLDRDPLLRFALEKLADGSPFSLVLYYAVFPLGKLENLMLGIQDDVHMIVYIVRKRGMNPIVPHQPASFDWQALATKAEQDYQKQSNNNPFAINNDWWNQFYNYLKKLENSSNDQQFLEATKVAEGWTDLDLLLQELKELGAEPLILSMPIHGPFFDYMGVSSQARMAYYQKLRQVAKSYGVPEVDFAEHDGDKYFFKDQTSHPSPKGWVYIDQVLDSFYHGTLLDAPIP
jgi:D-alanine transfer protein